MIDNRLNKNALFALQSHRLYSTHTGLLHSHKMDGCLQELLGSHFMFDVLLPKFEELSLQPSICQALVSLQLVRGHQLHLQRHQSCLFVKEMDEQVQLQLATLSASIYSGVVALYIVNLLVRTGSMKTLHTSGGQTVLAIQLLAIYCVSATNGGVAALFSKQLNVEFYL